MADNIVSVDDAVSVPFVSNIARAIEQTYTYASGSNLFCAIIPTYARDYMYRYIRPACQWLDGYVPYLHNGESGIPSTRIANKLITGITKQVVGEKLILKIKDAAGTMEDLDFASEWVDKTNALGAIYAAVGYALALGTSLVKMNCAPDQKDPDGKRVWWSAHRFDQCFFLANNNGEVYDATFNLRVYTDTRKQDGENYRQYILTEHRYYKICDKAVMTATGSTLFKVGDRVPMVEYEVHPVTATMLREQANVPSRSVNWEEIPQTIRELLKNDFYFIYINKPAVLPFPTLGVQIFKNAHLDLGVPTAAGYGEGMIVGIQDNLIMYEYAQACQIRDMYLGKGTVYTPKNLSIGDFSNPSPITPGGVLNQVANDNAIEILKGVDPEQQKALVVQHELRVDQWEKLKENCLKDIATKWGMSAKILATYLVTSEAQQTATQIDSEDDVAVAFIELTRSYFEPAVNELLETTLNAYGRTTNVDARFATPTLVNKDRVITRIGKLLELGLIDEEEAIRTYYTDEPESIIRRKIEICRRQREEMKRLNIMPSGDWNYHGDEVDGTTEPSQQPLAE